MPKTGADRYVVKQLSQLRALESPVRLQIMLTLERGGPSSIAELARALGRSPKALYHHVRRLASVRLVRTHSQRRSGARTEAIYALVARKLVVDHLSERRDYRNALGKLRTACLRLAERSVRDSIETGNRDTQHFGQQCVRLRPRAAKRLKALLDEAAQLAIDNGDPDAGEVFLVTTVMTPLRDRG